MSLLEPHLWAALVVALIAIAVLGWAIWKYRSGVAGDD